MAAMLCDFQPGDEVILPSFTHVGTANAFVRAGATLVFADCEAAHPNMDVAAATARITARTRAIVVVHYAGVACDMDAYAALATAHGLLLIEDAAHAIGAQYHGRWMGSFGHFAAFSFHETKNITCGQGGMLVLNDIRFVEQAAVLWENGTNRAAFFKGTVGQYTWVGQGSCFTLSDLNAAYLYGQLLHKEEIMGRRMRLWHRYLDALAPMAAKGHFALPQVAEGRATNGHIFYVRLPDRDARDAMISTLKTAGVLAVFHYIPLHSSPYFQAQHRGPALVECDAWSDCIVRLPLFDSLADAQQNLILEAVHAFCKP